MRTTNAGLADLVEQGQDRRADGDIDPDEITEYQTERSRLADQEPRRRRTRRCRSHPSARGAGVRAVVDGRASRADRRVDREPGDRGVQPSRGLPFMQNIPDPAGATVVAFVTKTVEQHTDHMKAFNAAATQLGGKAQDKPDQVVFDAVVTPGVADAEDAARRREVRSRRSSSSRPRRISPRSAP